MIVNGQKIAAFSQRNPAELPWGELGVDLVLECTGIFRTKEKAGMHLQAGAKDVIMSAPAKGDGVQTIVLGVNDADLDRRKNVFSNASCTTNCLAPIAKVLNDSFGLEQGFITTIHAYTADQNLQDGPHADLRRSRAAAVNMVPTSTGAAKAVAKVIPELAGVLTGNAVRVPTPNVSLAIMSLTLKEATTVDEVNNTIKDAAFHGDLVEQIHYSNNTEYVSSNAIGATTTSVLDAPCIKHDI